MFYAFLCFRWWRLISQESRNHRGDIGNYLCSRDDKLDPSVYPFHSEIVYVFFGAFCWCEWERPIATLEIWSIGIPHKCVDGIVCLVINISVIYNPKSRKEYLDIVGMQGWRKLCTEASDIVRFWWHHENASLAPGNLVILSLSPFSAHMEFIHYFVKYILFSWHWKYTMYTVAT